MTTQKLRIGLVVNPIAGIGGPAGLKGSDGVVAEAISKGSSSRAAERVSNVLQAVDNTQIDYVTMAGAMGADVLSNLGISHEVVGDVSEQPSADDTRRAVKLLIDEAIDLLVFAGGDGTARDVFDAFAGIPAVLGIPCGVKMHSGVFATSPAAAAELINQISQGELVSLIDAEVRDIDERSFRDGVVKTRFYGELPVPHSIQYMQQTKVGGVEVEDLVLEEMAADFRERYDDGVTYIMGSGSTMAYLIQSLGHEPTLLGVDVIQGQDMIAKDVSEQELLSILTNVSAAKIVVTAIGKQGHIFGRGNQQLSPAVIRKVGIDNIQVVATKQKLNALEGRPLLVDTGDQALDQTLAGLRPVTTGYEDEVLYKVA